MISAPKFCINLFTYTLYGHPLRLSDITYPLPSRPTTIKLLYFPHFSIFFLFEKVNACKRKANCAHKKASKYRLKVSLFAPCCEKSAWNAGAFLCAFFLPVIKNPILLSASSFAAQNRCVPAFLWAAPRDPTTPRRSIKFAASSAHSPVNSLPLKQYGFVRLASQAVPSPLKRAFKHCGAAIGSLIIKISRVANFYFAKVCSNKI